jgi:hypothetical protein
MVQHHQTEVTGRAISRYEAEEAVDVLLEHLKDKPAGRGASDRR